jgi:hypothetical protein
MEQDATAIANQLVDANLFDITGPIRINYSASSFQGGPQVSYKDAAGGRCRTFVSATAATPPPPGG